MPTMTSVAAAVLSIIVESHGAAAPQPPQFANLVAKFSADNIPAQTDNTALASWPEQISGLSATQGTGANQPVYRANRLGGKPSVQFTGTQWLSGLFPALKAQIDSKIYTVMIVINNAAVVSNGTVFGNSAGGNSFMMQATGNTIGRFDGGNVQTSVPWTGAGFKTFGTVRTTAKLYSGQSIATGTEFLYVDGMRTGAIFDGTSLCPPTSSASGAFGIGAISDLGTFAGKFDAYEILVWNRVLTDLEWAQAQKWACDKYSQTYPWAALSSLDVYCGDSITAGITISNNSLTYPYKCAASRGRIPGQYHMNAVGGIAWGDMTAHISDWSALGDFMGIPINVIAWEWFNERNAGHTPAQAFANCTTFCNAVNALTPAAGAIKLGLISSTGYTGDAADPYASVRGAYNTLMDGGAAILCTAYGAMHNDATAGPAIANSGSFAANSATYWSGDGVHLNSAGAPVLATYAGTVMALLRP